MKIQFLINSLTSGGAERVASTLFNELSNINEYEIFFFTIETDKFYNLDKKIKYESLTKNNINSNKVKRIFGYLFSIFKYYKVVKKNNPDILISFLEISNFITIIIGKLLKRKIIVSEHTNPIKIFQEKGFIGKLYVFLIKKLYSKSDLIVTVSNEIGEVLMREFNIDRKRIITIYNPHNISYYRRVSKELLEKRYSKIFSNSFIFIHVGRLTEAKGQWFLIRSFKKVVEKYPNVKLIILGEGELKEKLKNLVKKLKLEKNVFLLGNQKNPFKFVKNSDVFVFPSLLEGLPNTVIEALSLNNPVISSDCKTGPREILVPSLGIDKKVKYPYYGEYGILTKPFPRKFIWKTLEEEPLIEEEKMLADLMVEMIENKELRKKYSKGLKRAKDFDTKKIIKEWVNIFN